MKWIQAHTLTKLEPQLAMVAAAMWWRWWWGSIGDAPVNGKGGNVGNTVGDVTGVAAALLT
ncbi:MAG: hypothetical protein A3K25_13480 [Planctomycetes bacterium RIFOXYB12_FULL_42_10]|nr:MAG: hypothetical protein A2094_04640 [Planctomycetes bacterium GWE2_41_14]OHC07353.1 MAG: hypothetical protein A3K25_13480 [Planctomycetes bacterium RIFOXYB12_FULL_42_10]OHC08290.1 MAG: hypothetical protein A2545_05360 [Planctomycetes bacterium RIFOXYD2_FULL_41_16]